MSGLETVRLETKCEPGQAEYVADYLGMRLSTNVWADAAAALGCSSNRLDCQFDRLEYLPLDFRLHAHVMIYIRGPCDHRRL